MRRFLLAGIVLVIGLIVFGVAGAVQDPVVARYEIPITGLTQPLRIVQLSDSHASRIDMPASRLRRVVAQMNALKPDVIVLTGDYISGYPESWTMAETRTALAPLAALRAPRGVFAVLGNHDGPAKTAAAFQGTGIPLLRGDSVDAGSVWVVGADDLLRASPAVEGMRRAVRALPPGKPIIVISHEPDFFQYLPKQVVLLIAGHTHGGQIRFPLIGTMSHGAFLDSHLRGLFREHGQLLLVSSGLGTSILPMRIGVPPEIVEIRLVPAA